MQLVRNIRSAVMRRLADPVQRERQRARAERARQRERRPHEVLYFHQADDPYSQLAVQALRPLLARYEISLTPRVVAAPTPIAIHEQTLWEQWAQRDAAAIAPFHQLQFAACTAAPETLALARRLLLAVPDAEAFAALAEQVSLALHRNDIDALQSLSAGFVLPDAASAIQQLDANARLRHQLGHYLGGMFHYEGEWYWGIDRLHYLEVRLDTLGARKTGAPAGPSVHRSVLPAFTAQASSPRLTLEFYPSLRSPYTHLSYERLLSLSQRYPLDLVLKPVLPMMMRGVKADRRKGAYILRDTQREAERLGISFGNIWDPFGAPILRAYSLFPWARDQGRGFAYLHQYSQAVWSRRVNAWSLQGLRSIVEGTGLNWAEALKHLDNRDWEAEAEANVQTMLAAGSWGVPTLRLPAQYGTPEFTVWGQDRIWLIEAEIIRRLQGMKP